VLSLENGIVAVSGIAYAVGICLFYPDYITPVIQAALYTYSAISAGTGGLFDFTLLGTVFFTFVMFRMRDTSPYRRDIYYFIAAAPWFLAYALVNNGWGYTYQPIITLLLFINMLVLWEFLYLRSVHASQGKPVWRFTFGACSCGFSLLSKLAVVLIYFFYVFSYPCHGGKSCAGYYTKFTQEVEASPHPRSFGMIGMNYSLWTRVSKLTGAEWVTRFPQMWMVPRFIVSGPQFEADHRWILYYVAGALAEDLNKNKPDVVFVESSDRLYTIQLSKPWNWIAFFSPYVNFYDAWQHYAYVRTVDNCDAFEPTQEVIFAMSKGTKDAPKNTAGCRYDVYHRTAE
jgi:hypothetical protein